MLFGLENDFKEQFYLIHKISGENEENDFFDIKEKEFSEFILEVERENNKRIIDMKSDKEILKRIIKEARRQTNVTLEELGKIFDISKSTVGNYLKK